MASPDFSVTKSYGSLVLPCEPTPTHILPLSWFDKLPMPPPFVEMFMVYKHGQEPAKLIKQALAKALVPYYPLAGRIVRSEQGELEVNCTGDGVWFVEASTDCSLVDMGWLENPPIFIPRDQLLPSHPNPVGMSIMLQVTQFKCSGFIVGLRYNHIMADGMGIAQIMKANGEIAKNLEKPSVEPIWFREHVPNPPFPKLPPPSPPKKRLEYLIIDISQGHINQVKDLFMEQYGEHCSTFDVAVAQLWQCWIRVIGLDPGVYACLAFAANNRNLLSPFLPSDGGYYGNCVHPMTVMAPSGEITQASIVEIIFMIRDTKKRLPIEFSKWAKGEHELFQEATTLEGNDPMVVTDWSHLGFSEVDYGWGGPTYFAPVPPPLELVLPPLCIMVKPPAPKEGCRMITRLIKKEYFEAFYNQLMNFSTYVEIVGIS